MIRMLDFSKVFKIAGLEFKKHRSKTERKVILLMVLLGLLVYSSVALFVELGIYGTERYYTFYTEDQVISNVLNRTGKFLKLETVEADLFIDSNEDGIFVFSKGTDRAVAAITEFENAIKNFNNEIFSQYDERLAYPIRIFVNEVERESNSFERMILESTGTQETSSPLNEEGISNVQEIADVQNNTNLDSFETTESGSESTMIYPNEPNISEDSEEIPVETIESDIILTETDEPRDESRYIFAQDINPFEQFSVLLIIIIMTMPLSMLSLIYSNSIMAEKINKRGIFLLLAPLSKFEIIIGKTIPYLITSLLAFIPIIVRNTSGLMNIVYASLVILTIIIAYLSIGFFAAMIARSHKELSFLGIFMISLYSCYLLIPTFMLNFSIISLASPLSIVAKIFRGEFIQLQLLLFTILPTLISALCIFYFSSKMFDEQNLFSYRTIKDKIKDSLLQIVRKNKFNLFLISFFSIPIIFLIQLMMIVVVLSLRTNIAVFVMIFFAALIEEMFRNSGIYVILKSKKGNVKIKDIFFYSILAGSGFFVGEKMLLLIMIAPFIEAYAALVITGLFVPLTLHILLSFAFAIIVKFSKATNFWVPTLLLGIAHFLINLAIAFIGGGMQ